MKTNPTWGSAVVLCGGASSRMGFDKSLIRLNDRWLLDEVFEQLLGLFTHVMAVGECAYTLGAFSGGLTRCQRVEDALLSGRLVFLPDIQRGKGPMVGLLNALENSQSTFVYMSACDMPVISSQHIEKLKSGLVANPQAEIIVGTLDGKIEPFQGFYRSNLKLRAMALIEANRLSLRSLMDSCPEGAVLKMPIDLDQSKVYFNINDPSTLLKYKTGGLI